METSEQKCKTRKEKAIELTIETYYSDDRGYCGSCRGGEEFCVKCECGSEFAYDPVIIKKVETFLGELFSLKSDKKIAEENQRKEEKC